MNDGLEDFRNLARARWGKCTAFRLGVIIGECGARVANPYRAARAHQFRTGLRWAKERMEIR